MQIDKQKKDFQIFPHLHLLVSGGNSQIILLSSWHTWQIIGQTKDDAVGECLDKVGRMLGFPYPGGSLIARIANLIELNFCNFPLGCKQKDYDFSFSGLKTAIRYFLQNSQKIQALVNRDVDFQFEKPLEEVTIQKLLDIGKKISELNTLKDQQVLEKKIQAILDTLPANLELIYKVCVSAQTVAVGQLVNKLERVLLDYKNKNFIIYSIGLSGGVSANLLLREKINFLSKKYQIQQVFIPPINLTGDNAVMIALAGIANLYISKN